RGESDRVAQTLRDRGISADVAPAAAKFGKQIRYADRRGIPFVWFLDGETGHEVKDIRSGRQESADAAVWTPPEEDLWPRVERVPGERGPAGLGGGSGAGACARPGRARGARRGRCARRSPRPS